MNKLKQLWILLASFIPVTSLSNNAQAQFDPFITQPQLPPAINAPALELQRQVCLENNMRNDPRCEPFYKNPQRQKPRSDTIPESNSPQNSTLNNLIKEGKRLLEQGDYQNALEVFNRVVSLAPNRGSAYYYRGLIRYALKNYQGAIEDANELIRISPKIINAYEIRGSARMALGEYQGAIADANQAIQLDPNYVDAYHWRSFAQLALRNYQGALESANKAVTLMETVVPDNKRYYHPYGVRGRIRYELGDVDGAIQDWNDFADNIAAGNDLFVDEKVMPLLVLAVAVALYNQGDTQESLQLVQEAEESYLIEQRYHPDRHFEDFKSFFNLQFLKKRGWSDRLLADAQTFFNSTQMQAFLAKVR